MSKDYFDRLPPELILELCASLSTASLNWLALTCRSLHEILQPELECRITPELARELLPWAAVLKPHIVAKLLAPPHSVHPDEGYRGAPLHIAVNAGNTDCASLLLKAGASPEAMQGFDEYPLHLAAENKDLEMMKLLLDHGAPIDAPFGWDDDNENPLQWACSRGKLEMIKFLVERGASLECREYLGTALGFAVHGGHLEVVKFLLNQGADVMVKAPIIVRYCWSMAIPSANLLYIAMGLRHNWRLRYQGSPLARWEGLPLSEEKKDLMALLLASGVSKDSTMKRISKNLASLAKAAQYTEEQYLEVVTRMMKEAEDAIPNALITLKEFIE
ncbi:ankyrin repeat-containing domain protein [Mycena capillaripes]|nr:ankyrin repeat-containing domain protein [Mycena capillaripes]